ncbi:MAG: M48 family metallopeptidase [Nitrososphaerales archaeon]
MSSEKSIIVETDLPPEAVAGLSTFFERYYIQTNLRFIEQDSYRMTALDGTFTFFWKLNIHQNDQHVSLYSHLKISRSSVELRFQNLDSANHLQTELCDRTIDEVRNIVSSFLQNAKMSSLYFVIGANDERHSEAPTEEGDRQRSILRRILGGSSTNVFLLFTLLSFFLLFTIGFFALFLLIGIQFVYLVYSDKIILNIGNVHPTPERPLVSVVCVRSTPETVKYLKLHGKKILVEIREDVSKLHVPLSADKSDEAKSAREIKTSIRPILLRHGISTSEDDIEIRTKNVYEIVKNASEKFDQPVPKIVIVNTVVSNASATGISKKHSSIMITAGSLEDLTDGELESIVGHELGHVKGHDPIILFGLTSFQFIGLFYLWYPLVLYLGLFYFVLAFGAIYAVGKILETRADTESAVVLGDPAALASSLRKIGFRELYHEKYSQLVKLMYWFRFDPHPPLYFRISRMSEFVGGKSSSRHTFIVSLRDCVVGFFSAFF